MQQAASGVRVGLRSCTGHSSLPQCRPRLASFTRRTQHVLPVSASTSGAATVAATAVEHLDKTQAAAQVQQLLYSLADAAATADPAEVKRAGGWVAPLADSLQSVLEFLQTGLNAAHVPYSYGYSIILLTLLVKLATFPFTKKQVESALAVQSLKPRIDLIKKRYGDDKDRISKETNLLYEQAGVNPLAGCLPTLATIPVFIGLYSSLTNAANEGMFDTEGFYWLPSLSGPTTVAARQSGTGTAWLYPFIDGAPPIGWDEASKYLVLPVLLVMSQWASTALVSPPIDPDDPNANTTRGLYLFLPLMIGWFSLNVPSGLSLYYFANSLLSTLVQVYLKKLGGANVVVNDLGPVTKPGSGRRTGETVAAFAPWVPTSVKIGPQEEAEEGSAEGAGGEAAASVSAYSEEPVAAAPLLDPSQVSRRVKRRRLSLILQQQQRAAVAVAAEGGNGSGSNGTPAAGQSAA